MICSVIGSADGHDLILEQKNSGWQATLPPDLTDGQYVVTLLATDEAGNITTYRGVMYLCEGVCGLTIHPETSEILLLQDRMAVSLRPEILEIQFVRHWRC